MEALFQSFPKRARILTKIQNPPDHDRVRPIHLVVDGVGKSLGKEPMKSEDHPVGPGIEEQRVDAREQAVLKVVSQTFLLEFIVT